MTVKLTYITTIADTQWEFLAGQNAFMAEHGFELHAIASPGPRLDALVERDGVEAHPVFISRRIRPVADLLALMRLFWLLRRLRPEIVHVSTSKAAVVGATAAWLSRVPLRVFFMRGLASENSSGFKRRLFRFLEWYVAKICHSTICVAPSLLDFARRTGILAANQGKVMASGMSNGVDVERFDPSRVDALQWPQDEASPESDTAAPVVIGFVGRLVRDKGIEEMAIMWRTVREQYPNSLLLLVGPWDSHEGDTSQLREEFEADPRVMTTGWVDDVASYYRAMDIFMMPSHGTEGFPNAPMQAACMGLPVIATQVVGCVDAVEDGSTGVLIPARDSRALTEAVRRYLDDPDKRAEDGRRGRQRVLSSFSREPIWNALLREYELLLKSKNIDFDDRCFGDSAAHEQEAAPEQVEEPVKLAATDKG